MLHQLTTYHFPGAFLQEEFFLVALTVQLLSQIDF